MWKTCICYKNGKPSRLSHIVEVTELESVNDYDNGIYRIEYKFFETKDEALLHLQKCLNK